MIVIEHEGVLHSSTITDRLNALEQSVQPTDLSQVNAALLWQITILRTMTQTDRTIASAWMRNSQYNDFSQKHI